MRAKRILVPVDFSQHSQAALREADALAVEQQGELTLLFVHAITRVAIMDFNYVEPPERVVEACDAAERQLKMWRDELKTPPNRCHLRVETGDPTDVIVAHSRDHDLVVMATHGHAGLKHFLLGSVTERVVRGASCSVLIVRPRPA